jgi:hypothetical protein
MIFHAFPPTSGEEETRNLMLRLAGKADIPVREHVLTLSTGTQSIGLAVPMIALNTTSSRIAARVRVGLGERIPPRDGEVAGPDLPVRPVLC